MPRVDGGEFGERLRPLRGETKVLYVSGYAKDRLPEGDVPFLAKPFAPDALVAKVREMLGADAGRVRQPLQERLDR